MEVAGEDSVVETVGVQEEDSVEETVVDEVDSVAVEVRIYPTLLQRFRRALTLCRTSRLAGGRGGRGGGRGGYGGFAPQGPPDSVLGKQLVAVTSSSPDADSSCSRVEMGSFLHSVEGEMLCSSLMPTRVPYFNAPIYLENKTQIGLSPHPRWDLYNSS